MLGRRATGLPVIGAVPGVPRSRLRRRARRPPPPRRPAGGARGASGDAPDGARAARLRRRSGSPSSSPSGSGSTASARRVSRRVIRRSSSSSTTVRLNRAPPGAGAARARRVTSPSRRGRRVRSQSPPRRAAADTAAARPPAPSGAASRALRRPPTGRRARSRAPSRERHDGGTPPGAVSRLVRGDPGEPAPGTVPLPQLRQALPGGEQRLLKRVASLPLVAEPDDEEAVEPLRVGGDERLEGERHRRRRLLHRLARSGLGDVHRHGALSGSRPTTPKGSMRRELRPSPP